MQDLGTLHGFKEIPLKYESHIINFSPCIYIENPLATEQVRWGHEGSSDLPWYTQNNQNSIEVCHSECNIH